MPPPAAVTCDLCNQKFFKRSFPIHRKQCEKKFATCYTECKKCLRKVSNDEIDAHQAQCKVIRKKPMARPKIAKERTIKPKKEPTDHEDGDSSSEESSDEEDTREECGFCHRKFAADRIAKHESICATNSSRKKRKQFKSAAQTRLEGTDFEKYMDPKSRRQVEKAPSIWKQDHERLQGIVQQGRLVKAFQDAGVPLTELPAPGTDLTTLLQDGASAGTAAPAKKEIPAGMKECPHCTRTFAEATAAKHIPKCKNTKNRPKKLIRKSKPVLEKPKEDHTSLIKTLVKKVLLMKSKKDDFYETKPASMLSVDQVVLTNDGRKGTIRYIGRVSELEKGYWAGVELDEAVGSHDGSIKNGFNYFSCAQKHGIFIRPSKVKKYLAKIEAPKSNKGGDAKKAGSNNNSKKNNNDGNKAEQKPAPKDEKSSSKSKSKPKKKEGLVERLREEVRINSPRQQLQEGKGTKSSKKARPQQNKEQQPLRPEVDSPPKSRKATSVEKKSNKAEQARQERIAKDVKMLEALHGKMSNGERGFGSREEVGYGQKLGSSSSASMTGTGHKLKPDASSSSSGPSKRPDRAARAEYFEKMFAQKKQETA